MSDREPAMTCEQFALEVHDWSRWTEGGEDLDGRLEAHAAKCPGCAQLLADVCELNDALRVLASQDAAERAPEHLEAALLQAFRKQKASSRQRNIAWHRAALAAAAVILAALGIAVHRLAPNAGGEHPGVGLPAPRASHPDALPERAEDLQFAENAATFVALPYADENFSAEDGTIARVVMPRATLASMGLPVTDIDGAPMAVEVVLSEDGTPQAIRLSPENGENTQEF